MPENRFRCKRFFGQPHQAYDARKVAERRTIRREVIGERALRPIAQLEGAWLVHVQGARQEEKLQGNFTLTPSALPR